MKPLQWVVTRHRIPVVLAATGIATVLLMLLRPGVAHALGVEDETAFVFNTFSFLVWGALVMWMCAGFTMLEAGSVRTKNASMICMKNIGLYSIAGLACFIIGYNLMYVGVGRDLTLLGLNFGEIIGTFSLTYGSSAAEAALLEAEAGASAAGVLAEFAYSSMSDWFFQMVFVATTASIVSGALAERVKMWSFFLFTLFLTAFTYPLIGAWTWGGGWLNDLGFMDFAGSTIVHSTGGWAALAGLVVIGPRLGKFGRDGSVRPTPPSNILVVTLGVFILWFGWFGFNGGSQLALGSAVDAVWMSIVLVNTNLAAAAGVVVAILVSRPILGRTDLFAVLNGAIAGLVSITAAPNFVDHYWAIVIGAIGGVIVILRPAIAGAPEDRRRRRRGARPPLCRHLGHTGGEHRRRRAAPHPTTGRCRSWRNGLQHLLGSVEGLGHDAWRTSVPTGGAVGSGRRRAPHGVLPGVRPHAGPRLLR